MKDLLCLLSITNEIYNILGEGHGKCKSFSYTEKFIQLNSGVKICDSCRHIFMEYRILTVALLYTLEVLCFIKKFKGNLKHNFHFNGYNTKGKIDLHT
jgi:hypothetical protein